MTLANRLIRGSFSRVLNLIITVVVAFFMMPFVIKSIGDRWYGLWILAASFIWYYGFFDLGLSTAIQRFISRELSKGDENEVNKIFNTCLLLFIIAGILILLTAIAIAAVTPHFVDNTADIKIFRVVILIIGFDTALAFPLRAFDGFLYAVVRFDILNAIEIPKLLIRTALIVIFLSRGHGIIALAIITLCTNIMQFASTILVIRRFFPIIKVKLSYFTRQLIRSLLSYSIFSLISNIADKFRFHLDAFIITVFLGLSLVTHYNIGTRIAQYYIMFIFSAVALMMPVFSQLEAVNDYAQIRTKYLFVSRLNTILSIFIGGTILIYGKAFIVRWMGEDYIDSYQVLAILVLGIIFNTMQITPRTLLFGLSKHKKYSLILVCETIVKLILSITLIKRYGIIGVAIGTAIPMFITSAIIIPIYATRAIDMRLSQYARTIGSILALTIVLHAITWLLLKDYITASYARIILLGSISSFSFLAISGFVLISRQERSYFKIPI